MQDTPDTLLEEIQNGSNESFFILAKQYAPLVAKMVSSFFASGGGARDELLQEAESALLKAALTYDKTQTAVSFGLYAKICIRTALISYRRKVLRRTQREISNKKAGKSRGVQRVLTQSENAEQAIERIVAVLSPYERCVLREYISGKSVREIAQDLNKESKSVYNALFRIREKGKQLERSKKKKD